MSNRSSRPGSPSSANAGHVSNLKVMPGRSSDVMTLAAPYQLCRARHGTMLVNTNDIYMGQAFLKYGECCEIELSLLLQLLKMPGLIVEVGANMGIHTIPLALELARQGRGMLVFEPQPVIFQQLCANLALNGLMNVTALPYACGGSAGMVAFEVPDYRQTGNFGGLSMEAPVEPRGRIENVPRVPLDDIVPSAPVGLLKIDVEGQELAALEGAAQLLARSRPVVYIENDRPENSPALIQWLWDHGYQMWWHTPTLFNPANHRGDPENVYGNTVSLNMLCFPEPNEHALHGFAKVTDVQAHPLKATAGT